MHRWALNCIFDYQAPSLPRFSVYNEQIHKALYFSPPHFVSFPPRLFTLLPCPLSLLHPFLTFTYLPLPSFPISLSLFSSLPSPPLPSLPPSLPPSCSYVLRRILRRGIRYCTEVLNGKPGMFASLVPVVVESLVSHHYVIIEPVYRSVCIFTFNSFSIRI